MTEPIATDEDIADDTCPTFLTECHFDPSRFDCARCLPGGCQCSWEPVKHLCVRGIPRGRSRSGGARASAPPAPPADRPKLVALLVQR